MNLRMQEFFDHFSSAKRLLCVSFLNLFPSSINSDKARVFSYHPNLFSGALMIHRFSLCAGRSQKLKVTYRSDDRLTNNKMS